MNKGTTRKPKKPVDPVKIQVQGDGVAEFRARCDDEIKRPVEVLRRLMQKWTAGDVSV